ncbi:MAG: hypothetical protein ACXWWP_10075, partial [Candidatus Binatia bacterium]
FIFIDGVLTNFLAFIDSLVPCATAGALGIGTGRFDGVGSFFDGATGVFMREGTFGTNIRCRLPRFTQQLST